MCLVGVYDPKMDMGEARHWKWPLSALVLGGYGVEDTVSETDFEREHLQKDQKQTDLDVLNLVRIFKELCLACTPCWFLTDFRVDSVYFTRRTDQLYCDCLDGRRHG